MPTAAGITTYNVIVRSTAGNELDLGAISVDQSASTATIKSTLAAMFSAIASELVKGAYDGPVRPMPWLDNVDLADFTDVFPRDRALNAPPSLCGALPARAFRGRFPLGCVADADHAGNHCTDPELARRYARRALQFDNA